jgi:hypothetical protein
MSKRKPRGYWTKEKCQEEALKYNNKSQFSNHYAYKISRKNGWLNDICSHMEPLGNMYKRCIYAYEFPDKYVYIGLTYNINQRHIQRLKNNKDQVTKHIIKTGLKPNIKQLTDYLPKSIAVQLEEYYVKYYKYNKWYILNIAKTGSLGCNGFTWTYDLCKKEVLKYNSKSELKKYNSSVYKSIHRNKWYDLFDNLNEHKKPNGYWTKEKCQEEALKYDNKSDFYNNSIAYQIIIKNKWYELLNTLNEHKKPNGYWTKEKCQEEALKYNNKSDFRNNSSKCYNTIKRNGWIDDICSHMILSKLPRGYWTKEKCQEEALKYNNKSDFRINSPKCYNIVSKRKWLNELKYNE